MFNDNKNNFEPTISRSGENKKINDNLRTYMITIFNYMLMGLTITGAVAYFTASSPAMIQTIFQSGMYPVIMFAPLVFVLILSFGINRISSGTAQMLFWTYSAIMGLSLSFIFLVYTGESIARVFFITASTFGAMSIYGYTTRKDLTSWGSILFMALFGLIIASIVNFFFYSDMMSYLLSIATVIIFTGLTAYDTQKFKEMFYEYSDNEEQLKKVAVMGALNLYLDFINIFLALLRLMGRARD